MQQSNSSHSNSPEGNSPLRVCIQGQAGAFHEIAARFCFESRQLDIVPAKTFEELVEILEADELADAGLMAIENSLAGSLMFNYQLLQESELTIIGEVFLRIKQNLMALPGQSIEDLTEVHSHPMAIAQSREFFKAYPDIRLVEIEDTAMGAKNIQEYGLKSVGAIASTLAADLYGMEILAESIETNKKNHTRFLVLQKSDKAQVEKPNKFSICFSTDHLVGSLYKVLAVLAAYNVNLTKIQSMPIIGHPWEYRFFIDFVMEGDMGYEQALNAIRPITRNLQLLGVYRRGKHYDY